MVQTPAHDRVLTGLEIVTRNDLPAQALENQWDRILQDGYRIGATGGADSHTVEKAGGNIILGGGEGNHGKVGLNARTFAYVDGAIRPDSSFRSNDPSHPIRRALQNGRTIASNGPEHAGVMGSAQGTALGVAAGRRQHLGEAPDHMGNTRPCRSHHPHAVAPTWALSCEEASQHVGRAALQHGDDPAAVAVGENGGELAGPLRIDFSSTTAPGTADDDGLGASSSASASTRRITGCQDRR